MIGALLTATAATISAEHAATAIARATNYAEMFERYVQLQMKWNEDEHFKGCTIISSEWQKFCRDVTDDMCTEYSDVNDDDHPDYKKKRICCREDGWDDSEQRDVYVKGTCSEGADEYEMLANGNPCDGGEDDCMTWREHQTTHTARGCCDACLEGESHPAYDASCTSESFVGVTVCPEDAEGNEVKPEWLSECTTSGGFDTTLSDEDSQGCDDWCSYSLDDSEQCPEDATCDEEERRVAVEDESGNLMHDCPPHDDSGAVPGCPEGKHCHRSWMCTAPESQWECESSVKGLEALYADFVANDKWANVDDTVAWYEALLEDDTKGGFAEIMGFLSHAAVVAEDDYKRPEIALNGFKAECAVAIVEPFTQGIISASGGTVIVYKPNSLDGGEIDLTGDASATVIGGLNHGSVKVTSSGSVLVIGTDNAGPILADGASDVIISQVTNKAAVTVTNGATATILDTTNTGDITVTGDSDVKINGAVNSGKINVDGGKFHVQNVINSGDVVIRNAEVSGEVLSNTGTVQLIDCTGSLSIPDGGDNVAATIEGGSVDITSHSKDTSDYTAPTFFIGESDGGNVDPDGGNVDPDGGNNADGDDSAMAMVASAAMAVAGFVIAV